MLGWIWSLIVGGVIGALAGVITSRDVPAGILGNIIAGLVGAWIGQALLGTWGPSLAGMAVIPSIIGAVILVLIVSALFGMRKRS
ncbi:GlsB/YeaQ/YmgE family stress response membrane protein [Lactiplantibacillus sp. WILCCON 0030]|uniref:GlsB/YeaQ/YmgE family stress response membrane protein n=1 Tax=Lactiplantibacillus brownii TaxID=3069269 RepID=A0ABU1A859_9LACO|nr:GlsB/YeaQ/YmgE family stress response membrane protein [Lactiplantibacillus brownii]MDQ7937124.1 GlsB/YeaQ/YmgE family stress response membrane protein [Lactiplantibacillus brownii]